MDHCMSQKTSLEFKNKGVLMKVQLNQYGDRINFYLEDDFYEYPLEFDLDTTFTSILIKKLECIKAKIKE